MRSTRSYEFVAEIKFLEQPQRTEAGAILAAEHQMIDDRAVERLGGAGETASGAAIAVAWSRIATWMIVGEHDPGAAVNGGIGDGASWRRLSD